MFTGIVQEIGTISRIKSRGEAARLTIAAPKTAHGLMQGESVAVNGACLTVVGISRGLLQFEMISETKKLTTLGALRAGSRVNLERSLSVSDRLNGHVVLGHVDGIGRVIRRSRQAGQERLVIRVPKAVRLYVVPKGPITIDGVSLTIGGRMAGATIMVYLIPETMRRTTLVERRIGDAVNLEADYIAKLVLQRRAPSSPTD